MYTFPNTGDAVISSCTLVAIATAKASYPET